MPLAAEGPLSKPVNRHSSTNLQSAVGDAGHRVLDHGTARRHRHETLVPWARRTILDGRRQQRQAVEGRGARAEERRLDVRQAALEKEAPGRR
jgi:hypothetical protein